MSAARVALDVLLSADDPSAALGELLALVTKIPALAETLPDHCRLALPWRDEDTLFNGPAPCRRDALNWGLLAEIVCESERNLGDSEDSYRCTLTAYACDDARDEVVYRSSPEAAREYLEGRLVGLGWRLLGE